MRPVAAVLLTLVLVATACTDGEPSDVDSTVATSSPPTSPETTTSIAPTTTTSSTVTTTTTTIPATATSTTTTSATTTTTVPPDVTPPALVITDPAPRATVETRTYAFRGTTEPGSTVSAWDRWDAEMAEDGTWSIVLALHLGSNVTRFRAVDAAGNETVTEMSVDYVPPPMPCEVHADTGQEYCDVFGDIIEVDLARSEVIFDLYRFVSPGPEGSEFVFVNENPLLRTLRVADDVEIWACPPSPGTQAPGTCDPGDYDLWTLADLAGFVTADAIFWNVMTLDSIVVDVGQPCPVCG